jgi:hypothetical protein
MAEACDVSGFKLRVTHNHHKQEGSKSVMAKIGRSELMSEETHRGLEKGELRYPVIRCWSLLVGGILICTQQADTAAKEDFSIWKSKGNVGRL